MNIRMTSAVLKWVKSRLSLPMSGPPPKPLKLSTKKEHDFSSGAGEVREWSECPVSQGFRGLPEGRLLPLCSQRTGRTATQPVTGGLPLRLTFLNMKGGAGLRLLLQEGRREEWSIISVAQDFHNVAWGASNTEPWGNWDSETSHGAEDCRFQKTMTTAASTTDEAHGIASHMSPESAGRPTGEGLSQAKAIH